MHDPDSYESFSQFQRRDAKELVPYLVAGMNPKSIETVLDFGCGSGYNTRHVILPTLNALHGPRSTKVYAIDISTKMIEYASVRYAHPDVTYMVADIMKENCEFPCLFDKIFSLHVLHWIPEQKKALKTLWRLLKPQGEIAFYHISHAAVFQVYEKMSQMKEWKGFMGDARNFIPKTHFSIDAAQDMGHLMGSVGFQVQEAKNCRRKFCFDSFDQMIEAAMAANPFILRIPESLRESYKADFRRCFQPYVKKAGTEGKPNAIEVEYGVVLMRGKKQ